MASLGYPANEPVVRVPVGLPPHGYPLSGLVNHYPFAGGPLAQQFVNPEPVEFLTVGRTPVGEWRDTGRLRLPKALIATFTAIAASTQSTVEVYADEDDGFEWSAYQVHVVADNQVTFEVRSVGRRMEYMSGEIAIGPANTERPPILLPEGPVVFPGGTKLDVVATNQGAGDAESWYVVLWGWQTITEPLDLDAEAERIGV